MDPTNANAHAAPPPGVHPVPDPPHLVPQPPAPTGTAGTHSLAQSGEQCSSCGAHVAAGQRYCLHCGARCGDPRLPFMSAVTFMDAMKAPAGGGASSPPPHRQQRRMSPNMALFATIGVLLLAMGVGVLIGRSGNHQVASTAPAQPQIIKVGGGGEETTATTNGEAGTGKTGGGKKVTKKKLESAAKSSTDSEKILHSKVPIAPPETQLGDSCKEGVAGCKGGKFTGEFFGE